MAVQDIYLSVDLMMVDYESLTPDMWNFVWIYIMSVPVHTIDNIFHILTLGNTVSGWSVCLYVEEITDLGSLQWNPELRNIHCIWHCVIVLYFKNISFCSVSLASELPLCTIYSTTSHRNWCFWQVAVLSALQLLKLQKCGTWVWWVIQLIF